MKIIYRRKFINEFNKIWDYISEDSVSRANKFQKDIKNKVENICYFPYKCRKSSYFEDKNIRDLIFKGYTIPYKITDKQIIIIGIIKYKDIV